MGRCENGFDSARSCQCDSMCKYYKSCCSDYEVTCAMMSEFKQTDRQTNKPWTTRSLVVSRQRCPLTRRRFFSRLHQVRGDSFVFPDEDYDGEPLEGASPSPRPTGGRRGLKPTTESLTDFGRRLYQRTDATLDMIRPPRPLASTSATPTDPPADDLTTRAPRANSDLVATTTAAVTTGTTEAPDPDAEVCSGRPFDAFMQIKNGSIFAFRGERDGSSRRGSPGSTCVTFLPPSRQVLLRTGPQVGSPRLPQTHQGRVGHRRAGGHGLHALQLPRKDLHFQGGRGGIGVRDTRTADEPNLPHREPSTGGSTTACWTATTLEKSAWASTPFPITWTLLSLCLPPDTTAGRRSTFSKVLAGRNRFHRKNSLHRRQEKARTRSKMPYASKSIRRFSSDPVSSGQKKVSFKEWFGNLPSSEV